jgi:hypothetical protein
MMRSYYEIIAEADMKVWLATLMVALLAGASQTVAADCPAALDFYQRPLLGDKPVHLCNEFRGRVLPGEMMYVRSIADPV